MSKYPLIPVRTSKDMLRYILGETNYSAVRAYYRFQLDRLRGKSPLFVHSMGKVGSSTIVKSLRKLGLEQEMAIYWTNFLSPEGITLLNQLHERGYGRPEEVPIRIKTMLATRRIIGQQLKKWRPKDKKIKVISLVRDPIATNISGFFQNFAWWPPELQCQIKDTSIVDLEDLIAHFFSSYPHDVPSIWFEMEIEPIFGVDVFSSQFQIERGYQIYQGDRAKVLLLKLERLDECAAEALHAFLNVENFTLVNDNIGHDKWYGTVYDQFRAAIRVPDSYLKKMYQSKYTRHFYSEEEINTFITKWNPVLSHHSRDSVLDRQPSVTG